MDIQFVSIGIDALVLLCVGGMWRTFVKSLRDIASLESRLKTLEDIIHEITETKVVMK